MAAQRKAPLHVPIAMGVTAGIYAVSLAGITALQSGADAALAASRQPLADGLSRVSTERAALEGDLRTTVDALNAAGQAYGSVGEQSASLQAAVAALASEVQAATGAAASVPSSIRLPAAPTTVTVTVTAPATSATTGASGKP